MKAMFAAVIAAMFVLLPALGVYAQEGQMKLEGVKGIVQDIAPYYGTDGGIVEGTGFITIDKGDGDIVVFLFDESTEFPDGLEIKTGAEIEAFYNANLPVILIYPPRYNAVSINVITEASAEAPQMPSEQLEVPDPSAVSIVIEGEEMRDIFGFQLDGVLMVPIRAVAERLGYDVGWDAALRQVTVGKAIRMTIGKDEYIFARMAPIKLGMPLL